MPYDVTVALLGDPSIGPAPEGEPIPNQLPDEEWNRPWDDRPKVSLTVSEEEAFGSILAKATRAFKEMFPGGNFEFAGVFYCLFKDGDEFGATGPLETQITLVDEAGQASWGHPFDNVTFGHLLRAAQAGAVTGDPLRPYLVLNAPMGNGVSALWPLFLEAWRMVLPILEGIDTLGGGLVIPAAWLVTRLRNRLRSTPAVLESKHEEWAARGALPGEFLRFLDQHPWSQERLARLLGCTTEEAGALLAGRGFTYDPEDARWHLLSNPDARLLGELWQAAVYLDAIDAESAREEITRKVEDILTKPSEWYL